MPKVMVISIYVKSSGTIVVDITSRSVMILVVYIYMHLSVFHKFGFIYVAESFIPSK